MLSISKMLFGLIQTTIATGTLFGHSMIYETNAADDQAHLLILPRDSQTGQA